MHVPFDKSGSEDNSIYRKWSIGFLTLPALLVTALFALAILQPPTSNWIAEVVAAEFTGISLMPNQAPMQLARPVTQIRTVHAD